MSDDENKNTAPPPPEPPETRMVYDSANDAGSDSKKMIVDD